MVIHALRNATPKDRSRLLAILGMHTQDEKLRREAINIIRKYNSVKYAKGIAERLMRESLEDVDKILQPSKAKEMLMTLANYLIERKM